MAKVRSPNYPQIDLGSALEIVRPAWKAEHRNKMSRAVLARHMGYSSLNGRALGRIGAVRAYGLIDGTGDELRISDDAVTVLASPDHVNLQYREALERLALKPQLFQDIKKQFPSSLPSETNLGFWLVQQNFTQEAAGKAAKSFLASMRLVYEGESQYNPPSEPRDNSVNAQVTASIGEIKAGPHGQAEKGMRKAVFPLSEGDVVLMFPQGLGPDGFDELSSYLQIFLKQAKRDGVKDQ
jgi:hypothetical protein